MFGKDAKYIVFKTLVSGLLRKVPVIFPASVSHHEMAVKMDGEPVSAGFVNPSNKNGVPACYGESESLGLESRERDSLLVAQALGYPLDSYKKGA